MLILLTFSCKEAQRLVCNQRDFIADYETLCHGSFFRLIEFMSSLSKKDRTFQHTLAWLKHLPNRWPHAKPRNTVMLLSSCNLSELIGHLKISGKVAWVGSGAS